MMTIPDINSKSPLARAARAIIWDRYDGGPPYYSAIPQSEWEDAVKQAMEAANDKA